MSNKIPEVLYTIPNSVSCLANARSAECNKCKSLFFYRKVNEIYMAGNGIADSSAYFCATFLFTYSPSMLAPSHMLVKSIEAGINVVTTGRMRRDQADIDLDTRKATVLLLCLTSFLPWVLLQALPLTKPLARHPVPTPTLGHSPVPIHI